MPVTKGGVKQGREELEDDEIDLEEEKENEDIGEDGKMSKSLHSWINVKAWKELSHGPYCNIAATYLRACKICLALSLLYLFSNWRAIVIVF